jgi:hypothetical protein
MDCVAILKDKKKKNRMENLKPAHVRIKFRIYQSLYSALLYEQAE